MPRKYQRKTNRAETSEEQLKSAAQSVSEGLSIRNADQTSGINRMTLAGYLKNRQKVMKRLNMQVVWSRMTNFYKFLSHGATKVLKITTMMFLGARNLKNIY